MYGYPSLQFIFLVQPSTNLSDTGCAIQTHDVRYQGIQHFEAKSQKYIRTYWKVTPVKMKLPQLQLLKRLYVKEQAGTEVHTDVKALH